MKRTLLAIALPLAAFSAVATALADDDDHDRALQALRRGEVVSLRSILDRAAQDHPGDLIEAELEEEDGRTIYELKMLTPDGRILKLEYDARTGDLLKARERHHR